MAQFLFVESLDFSDAVVRYLADDHFAELQAALSAKPESGNVIPGAGPLRKLRWPDSRGSGKRGGLRVIYVVIPDISVIYLADLYRKNEADDLSPRDKKLLAESARLLVASFRDRHRRGLL